MLALTVAVALSLIISACCSVTEAILYSVPWSHVEQLRKSGRKAGQVLFDLRSRIEQPITAVLTLNTVANTAGAAIAGAYAADVLGDESMAAFAAGFTLLILILGEIIPKTVGVAYARPLSEYVARPVRALVVVLLPVIWLGGRITRLFTPPGGGAPHATEDDIRAIVSLSRRAGRIEPYEELSIRNILSLDQKRVHEVMTPRTVVFSLPADMTVAEAHEQPDFWHYSRVPVWGEHNEDVVGIAPRRRVLKEVAEDNDSLRLSEVMLPVHFVPDTQTLDRTLLQFLEARTHLFVVLDEYGGLAGVISLEDVLEEILGREIVDETDRVDDLQELARRRRAELAQSKE